MAGVVADVTYRVEGVTSQRVTLAAINAEERARDLLPKWESVLGPLNYSHDEKATHAVQGNLSYVSVIPNADTPVNLYAPSPSCNGAHAEHAERRCIAGGGECRQANLAAHQNSTLDGFTLPPSERLGQVRSLLQQWEDAKASRRTSLAAAPPTAVSGGATAERAALASRALAARAAKRAAAATAAALHDC
jgi:hypothetical protein